uniref:Uncharacterized protein n=1 Tax=Leptocylindrus danicus TaxID=163516 RepID=A0A7S2P2M2_9STRA
MSSEAPVTPPSSDIVPLQQKENVASNNGGKSIGGGLKRKQTVEGAAKFWEKQYRELNALRQSQQEKMSVAMRDEFLEHEKFLNEKILALEQQLKEAKEIYERKLQKMDEVDFSQKPQQPNAEEDALTVEQQAKTIQSQQEMISYFEMLTSTTLEICDNAVDCTVINHEEKLAAKFRISKNGKDELRGEALANAKYLPEYLAANQSIEFEKTQCPSLLKDVLQCMFRGDDGEEEAKEE